MLEMLKEAYWTADTQKDGLMEMAGILTERNPHLHMVAAIVHADAIAYCLHNDLDRCALQHLHEALTYPENEAVAMDHDTI